MKTVRKSADGNLMIVQRASGFAVSQRAPHWNAIGTTRLLGVQSMEWQTKGTGLGLPAANALFASLEA